MSVRRATGAFCLALGRCGGFDVGLINMKKTAHPTTNKNNLPGPLIAVRTERRSTTFCISRKSFGRYVNSSCMMKRKQNRAHDTHPFVDGKGLSITFAACLASPI
jgi:hypothetical protein